MARKTRRGQNLANIQPKADHFKEAQKAIKKSQPNITSDSLGYHNQANAATIADQVIEKLTAQRDAETATQPEPTTEQIAEH
jgi:hypothetical protein